MAKQFTVEEVTQHTKETDLYIIIDGEVYDLSKFIKLHPGGKNVLMQVAGQDASEQFWQFHNKAILNKYKGKLKIGTLENAAQAPAKSHTSTKTVPEVAGASKATISGNSGMACIEPPAPRRHWGNPLQFTEPSSLQGFASPYYTESHHKWRTYIRDFVEREIMPYCHEWDEAKELPKGIWEKLGEAGIMPVTAGSPWQGEKYAGIKPGNGVIDSKDYNAFHSLVFRDEMCRTGSSGFTWGATSGNGIGLPPVVHFGTEEQKQRWLPDVMRGKKLFALAITEPQTGSDVANLHTSAKLSPDGKYYIVNGVKKWITGGMYADYFTTAVRTGGPGAGGISCLVIPRTEGVTTTHMKCQGVWASGTAYVEFNNVKVPVENRVGLENQGFRYIMWNFNYERLGSASASIGFSRCLIEEALGYAFKRKTFGKRLIEHPVIRLKLANMARQVETAYAYLELLTYQTTVLTREEVAANLGGPIALLKSHGSEVMEYCAREASQIFGGLAYTRGGQGEKVERLYREVRAYAIPAGSEEIMRDFAIRQIMSKHDKAQKAGSRK